MERTEARPHLNLPHHVVLSLLSGKVEEIEGHLKAVEGGALFGVIDQEKWWGVINHSLLVRRVAMGMANLANQVHKGDQSWCNINVDLVGNGGLLEDFAKRYEKEYPGMDHVQAGVRILDDESINFPNKDRIKKMLVTHLYGMDGYNDEPANWEEKIIVLADHYATGEVVSLEERFADFKSRQVHGQTMSTEETEFWRIHDYCYAAQKEFMDTVGMIDESQLIAFLKNLPATAEEIKLREILRRQPEKAPRIVLAVERLQRIQAREKEAREKRNTVIFDFGGVITEDPDPEMINNMVGLSGIEAGRLEGALNQVVPLIQRGQIDEELACRQLEQILNIQIKVKAEDFFATKFKIKEETKALID
ncbi:hypothetical protein KKH13_04365, partial [Patescibacteria group bacterium]|nr:hypothetical protein [Patescibacteria group bacterium]